MVDGEILETNWGVLNQISKSVHTTTLAHWAEVLDDHMNDHNWKKLVRGYLCGIYIVHPANMVVDTCQKKYLWAVQNLQESHE